MESLLSKLLDKYYLKSKSIPIVFILVAVSCCIILPDMFTGINANSNAVLDASTNHATNAKIAMTLLIATLTAGLYAYYCYAENKLPTAKPDKLTVLFIVDTESVQFFRDIQKKMVSTFKELINDSSNHNFDVLCIGRERVENTNLSNKDEVRNLLQKTSCVFMVAVKYRVDSVTNAEDFEMQINYGVVHRKFEETAMKILQNDMDNLCNPINKRRFKKDQTLDVFEFTTQSLTIICKYVIGLVLLFSNEYNSAYSLFKSISHTLSKHHKEFISNSFDTLVQNRIYSSCIAIIINGLIEYGINRNPELLDQINEKLDEANSIVPNTYSYYLNKAYCYMAKSIDVENARRCIGKCKEFKGLNEWRYGDALLAAYDNRMPITIYKKYTQALKYDHDLLQVVNEVENYIDREPDRYGLHLAAGLLYDAKGDEILAQKHFTEFLSKNNDTKIQVILEKKMENYTCVCID